MGTIDLIILACFLPAIVFGLKNGFVKQLVAFGVIALGLALSIRFSAPMGQWITEKWALEPFWVKAISFSVIFIAVALGLSLIGKIVEKVLKVAMLGWLNRLLGMVVAIATASLIIGTLIFILTSANDLLNFIPEDKIAESRFWKPLLDLVKFAFPYLKSLF